MNKQLKRFLGNVSPWYIIGMSAILVILVLVVAFMNYDREQRHMGRLLNEKGAAIIAAIEAGTRTGMMGMINGRGSMQALLQEIVLQPDILYLTLVSPSGEILVHSDKEKTGETFITPEALQSLNVTDIPQWRIMEHAGMPKAFEVYKRFEPSVRGHGHFTRSSFGGGQRRGMRARQPALSPEEQPIVFIGMGYDAFNDSVREDMVLTLSTSGVLLLLGFGGMMSLFWLQSAVRSKKQLQDTQALTSEVVTNIPEGIIVCDLDDRISFANDIALQVLGLHGDGDSLSGKPALDILQDDVLSLRSRLSAERTVVEQEMQLPHLDGSYLPVSIVITQIISEDGASVGHLFMIRDLSQEKQLQEAIRKADRMAAIGHLAAGVAHEVRNPLSSIKGYATYFGSLFPEESENRKASVIMTDEVDRLNRVISELLEVARPTDIEVSKTDLPALLDSSLRLVKQEATGAGVTISFDIDSHIRHVTIDPDRITQALINLYINAIQAMPDGGELSVSVQLHGHQLQMRIADTGIGLPDDIAPRIFDPYFTTKKTGTGLGLSIVSKIIEAHGGSIEVADTGPNGTTFSLTLPTQGNQ